MKSAKDTRLEIFREYEEDPRDWHVLTGTDTKGYHDTAIVHHNDLWLLKEHMVNPYETVGFAVKETLEKKPDQLFPLTFGFRTLPTEAMLPGPEKMDERIFRSMLNDALQQAPVPLAKVTGPVALQGPILRSESVPQVAPSKQGELDKILRGELDNLVARRYGHLRRMYG